jgi:hypothetical protein
MLILGSGLSIGVKDLRVQRFKGSKVQGFKGSRVQSVLEFLNLWVVSQIE